MSSFGTPKFLSGKYLDFFFDFLVDEVLKISGNCSLYLYLPLKFIRDLAQEDIYMVVAGDGLYFCSHLYCCSHGCTALYWIVQ